MRLNARTGTIALLAVTATVLPGVATASAQARVRALVRVHASAQAYALRVTAAGAGSSVCGLLVDVRGRSRSLPFLAANKHGQVGWSWFALRSAPKGKWRFVVRCTSNGHPHTVRVARRLGHGGARGSIGDSASFRVVHGALLTPNAGADPKGLGGDPNPFPWHQCTWWAWVQRADVYDAAVAAGIPRGGSRGVEQGQTVYVWDGARWFFNAQQAGIPTGQVPVAGALVGWDGYAGNPYGHIAYVDAVQSMTSITISECDGFTLICDSRTVNPTAMKGRLEGYIYGGPAGNGPAPQSPVTPPVSPPPAPATRPETTGGATNTWTNYANAGGSQGQTIPANATVQIACKVTGFQVADGNTTWYRVSSDPWKGTYYASADAFYNNGQTSGSLHGTPYMDPSVPNC
jgi:surface antigen